MRKRGSSKRVVTAMSPFPEGSSMVNTCPTNAGPPPPPPLTPPPGFPPGAAPAPETAIRAPGSGSGPRRGSEEEEDAEETGRRSGTARWGAGGAGEVVEEEAGEDGVGEERKGKVEAREWKGLDEEEERGMVEEKEQIGRAHV